MSIFSYSLVLNTLQRARSKLLRALFASSFFSVPTLTHSKYFPFMPSIALPIFFAHSTLHGGPASGNIKKHTCSIPVSQPFNAMGLFLWSGKLDAFIIVGNKDVARKELAGFLSITGFTFAIG